MSKLADFQTIGDSASLAKIGDKAFTVIKVEDSDYTQGEEVTKGVKITTQETFSIDGKEWNKLHTTRIAVAEIHLTGPIGVPSLIDSLMSA